MNPEKTELEKSCYEEEKNCDTASNLSDKGQFADKGGDTSFMMCYHTICLSETESVDGQVKRERFGSGYGLAAQTVERSEGGTLGTLELRSSDR